MRNNMQKEYAKNASHRQMSFQGMHFLRGFKTFLQNQHMPSFKLTETKSNLKEEENANAAKQMCNQSAIIRKKGKMAQNAETKKRVCIFSLRPHPKL